MEESKSIDSHNEKLFEMQKELITHSYSQGMAYTNLIMVGGFAGFFGLWKLTEKNLLEWQILSSALLMLISIVTFVLFEIYKMVLNGKIMLSLSKTVNDPLNFSESLRNHKNRVSELIKGVQIIWYIALIISVSTGVIATGILGFSFVCGLFRLI